MHGQSLLVQEIRQPSKWLKGRQNLLTFQERRLIKTEKTDSTQTSQNLRVSLVQFSKIVLFKKWLFVIANHLI